jgi:hypothetical protein
MRFREPQLCFHLPYLSRDRLNAVRAAFKAGVKPAVIARQFGVSQSDVRKVLGAEGKKSRR